MSCPQPPNASMTCHWDLERHRAARDRRRRVRRALDAARARLRLRHDRAGRRQGDRGRPARAHSDGTGWWLGGTTGGGTHARVLLGRRRVRRTRSAAARADRARRRSPAAGSTSSRTARRRRSPAPALRSISRSAAAASRTSRRRRSRRAAPRPPSSSAPFRSWTCRTARSSARRSQSASRSRSASPPHVLAVLSRSAHNLRLAWYDPATGHKLGGIGVPIQTASALAVSDQFVVYRFGRALRALVLATAATSIRSARRLPQYLGLSLDNGRLVWAENRRSSGRHPRAVAPRLLAATGSSSWISTPAASCCASFGSKRPAPSSTTDAAAHPIAVRSASATPAPLKRSER